MLISHKHKFIFFHIPKTGGTSVESKLKAFSDITAINQKDNIYWHHAEPQELKTHFKSKNWEWNEYFKFAVVRNPWAFCLSIWTYAHQCKKQWQGMDTSNFPDLSWVRAVNNITSNNNYSDFCLKAYRQDTQYNFLHDSSGNCMVDYVCKLENIQKDMDHVCDLLNLPAQKIAHENVSNKQNYRSFYNKESRDFIGELCKNTISQFNYKF